MKEETIMAKTKEVQFNVKNVKYCLAATPLVISDVAYASQISFEAAINKLPIYGDGQKLTEIFADQGFTGALTLIQVPEDFLKDLGYKQEVDGTGIADISVSKSVEVHLYFEIEVHENDVTKTVKFWCYNVILERPTEAYQQTTETPNLTTYELPFTILGVNLLDTAGTADYTDTNGNTVKVWRQRKRPTDTDYATFGAFTAPKVKAS